MARLAPGEVEVRGASAGTYTYDAYGKQTGHTGTATSGLGFTGNLTDPSTGLVFLRARDYDPATGQFLTIDPLVDSTGEPYAYASNNPLLLSDPTGASAYKPETAGTLFAYWLLGVEPHHLSYGPGDRITKELEASTGGQITERIAEAFASTGNDPRPFSYSPEGGSGEWRKIQGALDGLAQLYATPLWWLGNIANLDNGFFPWTNDAESFVGGFTTTFTIEYLADCVARIHFHATNVTSWASFGRNATTGKTSGKNRTSGFGANLTETFDWTEDYRWSSTG